MISIFFLVQGSVAEGEGGELAQLVKLLIHLPSSQPTAAAAEQFALGRSEKH